VVGDELQLRLDSAAARLYGKRDREGDMYVNMKERDNVILREIEEG
jgi:hypothetical protein